MPTWNSAMGRWEGAGTTHIPLGESLEESAAKQTQREASFHPPSPDNTWYANGEDWYSTRTPWD